MRVLPLIALLLATAAAPLAAKTVAVTADKMIDVLAGKTVSDPVVIITDGRITAVGRKGQLAIPAGAETIDLAGKTILPGLIDMHVHLTSRADIGGYRTYEYTDSFWSAIGVANAKTTLDAGFTTVRNVGAADFQDVGLREAVDGGFIPGPRVVTAGYAIGATGGHCDNGSLPPSYDSVSPGIINGPEQARAKVRWLHKYGAQVIKICATGGVFSVGDSVGAQQLSYEEMKAIADEAHMLGIKVAAHAHGNDGIRTAIKAGIDTIEHCSLADDETIALAAKTGTWFDMDIYNDDYILATGTANGTPQESIDKEKLIGRLQRETFRKAVKAGVPLLFGTDAGVYPHGDNGKQFAKMVEWGMTPMQAIQAATKSGAEALGWTKDVGAIAVGRYGDIIAVDGDPIADVRTLEHVATVIKAGEIVRAD